MDLARRRVLLGDSEVRLTPTEYKLLALLARHAGMVPTHGQLLEDVWGPDAVAHIHSLHVQMAELRHTLKRDSARPRYLVTESGVGYRLRVE